MRHGAQRRAQLLESHLPEGDLSPGREIAIRVDQTLTQDATGTLVMLEREAMGLDRVRTELSAQYASRLARAAPPARRNRSRCWR